MRARTLVVCAAALLASLSARAADVLTQHNDAARTGANLRETVLNRDTLRSGRFGRIATLYADGQVVAQPLYVAGLAIDTTRVPGAPPVQGRFNTVIVATMHNTVYAYDADNPVTGPDGRTVPLWAIWLGQPRASGKTIDMWSTNDPEWGILGTPVISPDRATLYVVAWHDDGAAGLRYKLHALDLSSGAERRAVVLGASSADASQPCRNPAQSPFNPCLQKQRAALLLSGGLLYIGFGGDGNRGALFAVDAATLATRAFWRPVSTGQNGGIWQSGQGPAADADGDIYLMTGNGSFDADRGGPNYGDSLVRLGLQGGYFVVRDSFTPCNQKFLNDLDLDLGSGGPLLLPGTPPRLVGGGKEGKLYLVQRDAMGGFQPSATAPDCRNPNVVQEVLAFPPATHAGQTHYGNIHGSPVYWQGPDAARIYVWGENSALVAFRYQNGRLDAAAPARSRFTPPLGMPGGMLSLSADGARAGSGVVWAVVPLDGDANRQRGVKGIVLALDAQDVGQMLWTSEQAPGRDRLGLFAKFAPPTIADGKLFVASYGDDEPLQTYGNNSPTRFPARYGVAVYGLRPEAPAPRPIVNQDRDDVAVVRASTASLALDPAACARVDAATIDCTDALARQAGRPGMSRALLPADRGAAGCTLLRVVVASRNAGLANAAGIGFWSTRALAGNVGAGDAGRFVPKSALVPVGAATLRDGAAATLHEFVAVANCPAAGGDEAALLFKPYMQFEGEPDGRIYRNWDRAANYAIAPAIPGFDRAADVLR